MTGPALCGWGNWSRGSDPHMEAIVWIRKETSKAESETADLWQPKWNENQTVLASAIYIWDRNAGPLEGAVAGSWNLRIVKQSQCEGYCWMRRDRLRGCEGGDCWGECLWRKARQPWKQDDTAESCVGGGTTTIATLSPHASIRSWMIKSVAQTPEALTYSIGPHPGCSVKWLICKLQSRTPPRMFL